jgi:DNA modification methylase
VTDYKLRSLQHIRISELRPAPRNARTHSKRQIKQIADSIRRFGFTNPVLVDDEHVIIAGHGRVVAAKDIGLAEVPCLLLSDMSAADKRAYIIADNKLALNAGWDVEILAGELQGLIELGFDVAITGFELPEIDIILSDALEASQAHIGPEDEHPQHVTHATTRQGDLWCLGRHKLLCGDAKDPSNVERLMAGELADMIFTDPPYNVPIAGHVTGLGRHQHREFVEASGEMSKAQFTAFLVQTLGVAANMCRDGAIAFVCMDWRHLQEVLEAGHQTFDELKNICVWSKTNGGMGTFYRSQHEMVLVWKKGTGAHTNTFGLGETGRYRTNVWSYPGVNTFKPNRLDELAYHPTVKPVALVADAIRDVSNRGDLVLDSFGGSGTTLVAAEKTGRRARMLEFDPLYCDVIIKRWQTITGKRAVLAGTDQTYESIAVSRLAEPNREAMAV